jgi:ABC-type siderophore export system fused ATPase/permease subunit
MTDELNVYVQRKIRQYFAPENREEVAELLKRFPGNSEQGRKRVHLAILKLSQGNKEELARLVNVALTDYRDVLYWAEYCMD